MRIRRAGAGDLAALVALEQAAFATDRMSPRQFRYHLRHPRNRLLVAEAGGTLLGAALLILRRDPQTARLYSIAVAEAARGKGVGRRLLLRCEREARHAGAGRLVLEVRSDNAAARALYERLGYRVFARRAGYYQDGAEALRMSKTLHPPRPTRTRAMPRRRGDEPRA